MKLPQIIQQNVISFSTRKILKIQIFSKLFNCMIFLNFLKTSCKKSHTITDIRHFLKLPIFRMLSPNCPQKRNYVNSFKETEWFTWKMVELTGLASGFQLVGLFVVAGSGRGVQMCGRDDDMCPEHGVEPPHVDEGTIARYKWIFTWRRLWKHLPTISHSQTQVNASHWNF